MSARCEICKSDWDTYSIFISCFGCAKHFHAKCVKVKGPIGDVLKSVETNGLHWYCQKCRHLSPAIIHSKLHKTVESVEMLSAVANKLIEMIASCRAEVTALQQHVDDSGPTKPIVTLHVPTTRRTRSSSCDDSLINIESQIATTMSSTFSATVTPNAKTTNIATKTTTPVASTTRIASTTPIATTTPIAITTSIATTSPIAMTSTGTTTSTTTSNATTTANKTTTTPTTTTSNGTTTTINAEYSTSSIVSQQSTTAPIPTATSASTKTTIASTAVDLTSVPSLPLSVPTASTSSAGLPHKTKLVIVKHQPRRSIFVSRLAASTSENDITSYINESCGPLDAVLFCRKFNLPKERVTASFKITPPAESFDKLINPSFWPSGTFVREFKPRSRQRSNKPASVPSGNVSKN